MTGRNVWRPLVKALEPGEKRETVRRDRSVRLPALRAEIAKLRDQVRCLHLSAAAERAAHQRAEEAQADRIAWLEARLGEQSRRARPC